MERLDALVSGRVQMVMYRDFVSRAADILRLTGYVRNLPDGTVRVIAEGERDALEKLLVRLRKGSLLSKVEHIEASWLPATGEHSSFSIAY